jgi:hypothetical protein
VLAEKVEERAAFRAAVLAAMKYEDIDDMDGDAYVELDLTEAEFDTLADDWNKRHGIDLAKILGPYAGKPFPPERHGDSPKPPDPDCGLACRVLHHAAMETALADSVVRYGELEDELCGCQTPLREYLSTRPRAHAILSTAVHEFTVGSRFRPDDSRWLERVELALDGAQASHHEDS